MTPRAYVLAALLATAWPLPAGAHGGCTIRAREPREVVLPDGQRVVNGFGELSCTDMHNGESYRLNVCLHYSPVLPIEESIKPAREVPPTARVVACGTDDGSSVPWGKYQHVFHPCPYLPGYYRTAVSGASAGDPGEHPELAGIDDRSEWVLLDGTACL